VGELAECWAVEAGKEDDEMVEVRGKSGEKGHVDGRKVRDSGRKRSQRGEKETTSRSKRVISLPEGWMGKTTMNEGGYEGV
jgi:hypothetical protein